jgi:hypothetical protein
MRKRLSSKARETQQCRPRGVSWMILSACLITGVGSLRPDPALAQTSGLPSMQPSFGVGAASPFILGSGQQSRIPLGSIEIATPGIAPVIPLQNPGVETCTGSGRSSGALFDGGGLAGTTALSCADPRIPPSSTAVSPSARRVGIPPGATEFGNAGVSPFLPAPGPNQSGGAIAAPTRSAQTTTSAGLPGAAP